ncbi:MAG TPA: ribonuclease Y [Candidatus Paceibacterota bacterium]|nr:ribonuclease Y [Verrucomicrobiota bacterium]HRZ46716.1 ribonuclease Y [Candidatus Paceibacterota bacterium]
MNGSLQELLIAASGLILGGGLGYWIQHRRERSLHLDWEREKESLAETARQQCAAVVRDAQLAANEEFLRRSRALEEDHARRRQELNELDQRLSQRDLLINQQLEGLVQQEQMVLAQQQRLALQEDELARDRTELDRLIEERREQLSHLAHLSDTDARELLLKEVEQESLRDAGDLARHVLEDARQRAEDEARKIIGLAIQRYAGEHSFETTTATVTLPNEEIKGKIIGREGRNIRAFESATGVTVLIDDTPNAVVLSSFDPVRREIAREAMQRLILDGRIHPTRIEEVVGRVAQETDDAILRAGEEAVFKTGLPPLAHEVVQVLGRLRFRHSYAQNNLDHSVEVAHLSGLMAAELQFDVLAAKRAGLLHDIGKALNHEIEGAHAIIGAEFLKRHGESEAVVNSVASHHGEAPCRFAIGSLVSAADAISASRPGARSETMATYLKRLENLERIGRSFPGVEKCFAVQAGRELRVMVQPDRISDDQAFLLARNLAHKIEEELQYPGQIRITVVRETRCVEFAK